VPLTPDLALDSGLDVAAWDAEGLVDSVSVGTYQAYMNHPIDSWKRLLTCGTPVYAYIGCSPQTGQYLGLEEYRAAAANAYGSGADGIYLFNYPCLFELAAQLPAPPQTAPTALPDMRAQGHSDFSRVSQALDALGYPRRLKGKAKRFLFYYGERSQYRHHAQDRASLQRRDTQGTLRALFRGYEDYAAAQSLALRFKLENVVRGERFQVRLNSYRLTRGQQQLRYAANGRDTRIHTVALGPYLEYAVALRPEQLRQGENVLEVAPVRLAPELTPEIRLVEVELRVDYGRG
jgi:hypothetical protein